MKKNIWYFTIAAALTIVILSTGCASMNDMLKNLTGNSDEQITASEIKRAPRYSESQQMSVPTDRQYKHMTRNRMEEESDLGSNAGSTWVMDGQSSYLFAQNKTRREGDVLNVKLDGPAMKQVETKVSVIKKLLKQLEDQQQAELNNSLASNGDAARNPASEAAPAAKKEEPKKADEKEEALAEVQAIPTRLVEKLADGNYRLKGAQPFMIGKREYKVIVTGMIRPEDYNDEGVSSQKLLDPQYDVVSIRKSKTE